MLQFTSGVNDVELSLELANTAMNVATGHYYDEYGEAYAQQMGFTHTGFLRPGGNLVMKVYEVCVYVCVLRGMLCGQGAFQSSIPSGCEAVQGCPPPRRAGWRAHVRHLSQAHGTVSDSAVM